MNSTVDLKHEHRVQKQKQQNKPVVYSENPPPYLPTRLRKNNNHETKQTNKQTKIKPKKRNFHPAVFKRPSPFESTTRTFK